MSSDYKIWIEKSSSNLKWAKDNLEIGNFPLTCYLSQQAVELLLKGFIYAQNKIPPKTHQLVRLAKVCEKHGLKIGSLLPSLAVLSEYYLESRYPDELNRELDDGKIANNALKKAQVISRKVLKQFLEG